MRKLATSLALSGLAVALMAAGLGSPLSVLGAGPNIVVDGPMKLQLSSTMAGVTFSDGMLVCPPTLITASSGANKTACNFKIESVGSVLPDSLAVKVTVSGISAAEASARKFALDPHTGTLVYLQSASQTAYTFTGAQLPATVDPGFVWGDKAGAELDNSDLGATIVVTYTVVAQSLQGVTATPTPSPTKTPFQSFLGATGTPGHAVTPPPTSATSSSSGSGSTPLPALLICLLLAGIGLAAAEFRRRSVHR